jgi:hypothetical protein
MRAIVCLVSIAALTSFLAAPVDAAPRCSTKSADGTGPNEQVAKFQVYEGMLKSVDWGVWSQWMLDGSTPGYKVGKPVYVCRHGVGLGVTCRGRASICKT